MSIAGVRSNIGDEYQSLIAVYWATEMLSNPAIGFIEIDATSLSLAQKPYTVDDVVIHYNCGKVICCQCKKNAPGASTWKVSELKSDLKKAWQQWEGTPNADIIFYSRSDFGDMLRISERVRVVPNGAALIYNMPKDMLNPYNKIKSLNENTTDDYLYSFFHQLKFETLPQETLYNIILSGLRKSVTYAKDAFKIIIQEIDRIARRSDYNASLSLQNHKLTRTNLIELLVKAGHNLSYPKSEVDLRDFFTSISSFGRVWPRKIHGHSFPRKETDIILKLINDKKASILLHGGPGSGKTCITMELAELLEKDYPETFHIFIQTRELSNFSNKIPDLSANVARMAEIKHVVLLMDSLDVLSISDDNNLNTLLALYYDLAKLKNVTIIAACRTFDVKYDRRLAEIEWKEEIALIDLDFNAEVKPFLVSVGVDVNTIEAKQEALLSNPRMLSMYIDMWLKGASTQAVTAQELTKSYIDIIIFRELGQEAYNKVKELAAMMLDARALAVSKYKANISADTARKLLSAGVIIETGTSQYTFGHQTLVDTLAVINAETTGITLSQFITGLKPVPFIRPSIRTFLFHLRSTDASLFRKQVKVAINSDFAFHIKRLIATTFGEVEPEDEDWSLVKYIFEAHSALFESFFQSAEPILWFNFFQTYLLPELKTKNDKQWLLRYTERVTGLNELPAKIIIKLWLDIVKDESYEKNILSRACWALNRFNTWNEPDLQADIRELIRYLIENARDGDVCNPLSKWIESTDAHDDLLWHYLIKDAILGGLSSRVFNDIFIFPDESFLENRLRNSLSLLSLAINTLDKWGDDFSSHYSFHIKRDQTDFHHISNEEKICNILESVCTGHAKNNTEWWQDYVSLMLNSECKVLQYFSILGLTENPDSYIALILSVLYKIKGNNAYPYAFELSCLLRASVLSIPLNDLDTIQHIVLNIYERSKEDWVLKIRRSLLVEIPVMYRLEECQSEIDYANKRLDILEKTPKIMSHGGIVHAPLSGEDIIKLSDKSILRLLQYYKIVKDFDFEWMDGRLVGGAKEVLYQFTRAVSKDPERFDTWVKQHWLEVEPHFRSAFIDGITNHISYRFGNLTPEHNWWPCCKPNKGLLRTILLNCLTNRNLDNIKEITLIQAVGALENVWENLEDIDSLIVMLFMYVGSESPNDYENTRNDHLQVTMNSVRGIASSITAKLVDRLLQESINIPDTLLKLVNIYAKDMHPAVRVGILRVLPSIRYYDLALGKDLFESCMRDSDEMWSFSYDFLYYSYHEDFEYVRIWLDKMAASIVNTKLNTYADRDKLLQDKMPKGSFNNAKNWGQLWALAFLSDKVDIKGLIAILSEVDFDSAWSGALRVMIYNMENYYDPCLVGLNSILAKNLAPSEEVLNEIFRMFDNYKGEYLRLPRHTISKVYEYVDSCSNDRTLFFPKWLSAIASKDAELALWAAEQAVQAKSQWFQHYDDETAITLTMLFRVAEENEEMDEGAMLNRVIALQDALLAKGIYRVEEWLKEAERP